MGLGRLGLARQERAGLARWPDRLGDLLPLSRRREPVPLGLGRPGHRRFRPAGCRSGDRPQAPGARRSLIDGQVPHLDSDPHRPTHPLEGIH